MSVSVACVGREPEPVSSAPQGAMSYGHFELNDRGRLGYGRAHSENPKGIWIHIPGKGEFAAKYHRDAAHVVGQGFHYEIYEPRGTGSSSSPLDYWGWEVGDVYLRMPDGSRLCYGDGHNFNHHIADMVAVIKRRHAEFPHLPVILSGHSMGGNIALGVHAELIKMKARGELPHLHYEVFLDSPMLRLKQENLAYSVPRMAIMTLSKITAFRDVLIERKAPAAGSFIGNPLSDDPENFEGWQDAKAHNLSKCVTGTSMGWFSSAVGANRHIRREFQRLGNRLGNSAAIPVTAVHGVRDVLALYLGTKEVMHHLGPNARLIPIKTAKHSLAQCSLPIRTKRAEEMTFVMRRVSGQLAA